MKKDKSLTASDKCTDFGIINKTAGGTDFPLIDEALLKSRIYTIRGVKVMLDADLAEIYGYTTKRFNEQVKNNIEKFDEDFRFQLTSDEAITCSRSKKSALKQENLRSKKSASSWGGLRYAPYAFTEQGIYMLMCFWITAPVARSCSIAVHRQKTAATRLRPSCKSNAQRCTTP